MGKMHSLGSNLGLGVYGPMPLACSLGRLLSALVHPDAILCVGGVHYSGCGSHGTGRVARLCLHLAFEAGSTFPGGSRAGSIAGCDACSSHCSLPPLPTRPVLKTWSLAAVAGPALIPRVPGPVLVQCPA